MYHFSQQLSFEALKTGNDLAKTNTSLPRCLVFLERPDARHSLRWSQQGILSIFPTVSGPLFCPYQAKT